MSPYILRPAKVEDIEDIVNLTMICFSDNFNLIFRSRIEKGKIAFIEDLKARKSLEDIFVAEIDKKIIGVLSVRINEIQHNWFSTLKIFVKHLGILNGIKSIILGSFLPFSVSKDKCFFDYICVLPEFRRQNIGKDLWLYGEKFALEKDKKYVYCFIPNSNVPSCSKHIVFKIGFKEKGVKRGIVSKIFLKIPVWIHVEKRIK